MILESSISSPLSAPLAPPSVQMPKETPSTPTQGIPTDVMKNMSKVVLLRVIKILHYIYRQSKTLLLSIYIFYIKIEHGCTR
jgi:hypothetical protein